MNNLHRSPALRLQSFDPCQQLPLAKLQLRANLVEAVRAVEEAGELGMAFTLVGGFLLGGGGSRIVDSGIGCWVGGKAAVIGVFGLDGLGVKGGLRGKGDGLSFLPRSWDDA